MTNENKTYTEIEMLANRVTKIGRILVVGQEISDKGIYFDQYLMTGLSEFVADTFGGIGYVYSLWRSRVFDIIEKGPDVALNEDFYSGIIIKPYSRSSDLVRELRSGEYGMRNIATPVWHFNNDEGLTIEGSLGELPDPACINDSEEREKAFRNILETVDDFYQHPEKLDHLRGGWGG